jgi:KaiC/GvpD/RAD55 family RecA-like ATPase
MESIPFGVSRLDDIVGGGAPAGSVVLLSGESGAGAREFIFTSATMNALARGNQDLFQLHYGDLHEDASLPGAVHYVSFTAGEASLGREMGFTMDRELVDAAVDNITFRDFSPEFFQPTPVPREWYLGTVTDLSQLGQRHDRTDLLSALGTYLTEHAPNNLVIIDSLTDLVGAISDDMGWTDLAMVMKGLTKAANRWGGLILLLVSRETLGERQLGHLMDAAHGTLLFEWESGGSRRSRTLVVQEFRGVLSQLESENIVRFETEIHDGGFDVSDVRKIR